jgi:hypothetical protein
VLSLEPARIEYAIPAVPAGGDKEKAAAEEAEKKEEKKELTEEEKKKDAIINYTVCRLDFSAHIAVPGGQKTVHIEMQKAKLSSDIMRFRRYLGAQYHSSSNVYRENNTDAARQIYCIFLLGHDIDLPGHPIVLVDSRVTDAVTNDVIEITSNRFIDSLHHRSWIIQINLLNKKHRNDLERLLDVFDQTNRWSDDAHYLNVDDENFPEKYRSVYRRLASAVVSSKMRAMMEAEDDFKKREQENAEKDMTIEEKDKALVEKDRMIEEKDRTIGEHVKALEEKDRYIKELESRFAEMQRTT